LNDDGDGEDEGLVDLAHVASLGPLRWVRSCHQILLSSPKIVINFLFVNMVLPHTCLLLSLNKTCRDKTYIQNNRERMNDSKVTLLISFKAPLLHFQAIERTNLNKLI
jgi:hypothetical protein